MILKFSRMARSPTRFPATVFRKCLLLTTRVYFVNGVTRSLQNLELRKVSLGSLIFLDIFVYISGDMGGEIGLMLGASLLTFVEFIDLILFLIYHQVLRLYKKKKSEEIFKDDDTDEEEEKLAIKK